ncbi:hypothetical protein [Yersinia intermedia]|uniref:hypothetical protein n=1 Tax=Yersinia intermedia TaxID=631 RepID=UPI0022FE928F|nr:hypothetical protein [Yersinia intermedia]MDA5510539.1 hypothetical protein [Yersinia intermedia]
MKERPILFNSEMVNAILSCRKTQTRRIMGNQPAGQDLETVHVRHNDDFNFQWYGNLGESSYFPCPLGKPGDQLWGREAYRMARSLDTHSPSKVAELSLNAGYKNPWAPIQLEADGTRIGKWTGFDTPPVITEAGKLRPSLHMPRWASRINLLITGVRVERLNDISEQDAMAEGIDADYLAESQDHYDCIADHNMTGSPTAKGYFSNLWQSIYGEESWEANPWVWVIEFELIKGGTE